MHSSKNSVEVNISPSKYVLKLFWQDIDCSRIVGKTIPGLLGVSQVGVSLDEVNGMSSRLADSFQSYCLSFKPRESLSIRVLLKA